MKIQNLIQSLEEAPRLLPETRIILESVKNMTETFREAFAFAADGCQLVDEIALEFEASSDVIEEIAVISGQDLNQSSFFTPFNWTRWSEDGFMTITFKNCEAPFWISQLETISIRN